MKWSLLLPARTIKASALAALFGGLSMGVIAKFADESSILGVGMIGTRFGVWIVCVALLAAGSRLWQHAMLHAVTFLLAMVTAYYISQMLLFGFFSTRLFFAWIAIALLLAPPFAALVWQARGKGWCPAFAAAAPIGLLLAEAYSLRRVLHVNEDYPILFTFDIVSAVALLLILTKGSEQRARVLILTPLIVLGARFIFQYVGAFVGQVT